jgi:hypothetical protein
MTSAGLEARYRRLLRWFPAEHRSVHGEEMVGVLMTGTGGDRDRPGIAEMADLLMAAARIRLRPGRALSDGDGWRDALAIFSIAAPVLTLVAAVVAYLAGDLWMMSAGLGSYTDSGFIPSTFDIQHPLVGTIIWLAISGQALVVVLGLLGLRRWAAVAAAAPALYLGIISVIGTFRMPGALAETPFYLIPAIAETVALLASAGPRRGLALLRWRHWAAVAAGAVVAAAVSDDFFIPTGFDPRLRSAFEAIRLLAAGTAIVMLASLWLASGRGKRLAVLFALLGYQSLLLPVLAYGLVRWSASGDWVYVCNAVLVCFLAALLYRTRRRSRSARGD